MKILGTNFEAALQKKTLQAYEMVWIDIDGGIFLTNAPVDIEYDEADYDEVANGTQPDWTSVGAFLGFSEISEEQEFGVSEVTVTLAGIPLHDLKDDQNNDVNLFSEFLSNNFVDRKCKIYRAFFDEDTLIVDGADKAIMLMFDGLIDQPTITDDPASSTTVSVRVVNQWVDFQRTNGRHTNDAEQQVLHDNDRIFKFAKDSVKDIQWRQDA